MTAAILTDRPRTSVSLQDDWLTRGLGVLTSTALVFIPAIDVYAAVTRTRGAHR